jgi:hypothetical protein
MVDDRSLFYVHVGLVEPSLTYRCVPSLSGVLPNGNVSMTYPRSKILIDVHLYFLNHSSDYPRK